MKSGKKLTGGEGDYNDSGIVEDLGSAEDEEEERDELEFVKESMSELESVLESVTESVEDFVEHFVESEHDYLVKEHARLREEVNMLRDSPEIVLNRLPEELWIKVLGYLGAGELCTVSLVCRGFLHLSRDPSLWPSLALLGDALADTSTILALVSRCSQLSALSITARDDAAAVIGEVALHCPLLQSLTVKYSPPIPHPTLDALASGCPRLCTLDLESTGCLNSGCGSFHPEDCTCICVPEFSFPLLFAPLVHLTKVNLFACRNLHSAALRHLADTCTNLSSLNIDEVNYLSDASVNHLLEVRGSTLQKLWIDGESLSDASFSNFHKMESLELLSVSFSDNLGPSGLRSISLLKCLEWLRLRRGAELEPQHFVTAFELGELRRLTYLDLSECSKLDDSGLAAVAKTCPNLGSVSLNWCWDVTDVGLGHLVHRCRALVSLGLCGVVRLQGDCLPALPSLLPKLKLLDLEQCPDVELADLQDLVRKNLSLVVRDYYGEKVSPCRGLQEYLIDHPEVEFVTYDHEQD